MQIVKNDSGVYVAKIETVHGKRTINLQSNDRIEAKRIAKETGLAEIEMIARTGKVRREILAQVVLGRKVKASEAATEYREWLGTRVGDKQLHNSMLIVTEFLRDMKLGDEHVHSITERQLDRFINDKNSTTKASTRNLKISALRKFFDFCSVRNYAVNNPAAELRVNMGILRHEQKETTTGQPFTENQYHKILLGCEEERKSLASEIAAGRKAIEALLKENKKAFTGTWEQRIAKLQAALDENEFLRCAVQLGWETGLRFGDICQLEWASLEKPMRLIVWTDKTNTRVELKLKPGLSHLLRSLPRKDKVWVFPDQRERYADIRKRSAMSVEFSRFLGKLGIEGHSFHDFRHAYASRATREGMPLDHIRQRLGHSTAEMTRKYVH